LALAVFQAKDCEPKEGSTNLRFLKVAVPKLKFWNSLMYQFLFNIRKLGIEFAILLPFSNYQDFYSPYRSLPFVLILISRHFLAKGQAAASKCPIDDFTGD
jgi:hypothetical protein